MKGAMVTLLLLLLVAILASRAVPLLTGPRVSWQHRSGFPKARAPRPSFRTF